MFVHDIGDRNAGKNLFRKVNTIFVQIVVFVVWDSKNGSKSI